MCRACRSLVCVLMLVATGVAAQTADDDPSSSPDAAAAQARSDSLRELSAEILEQQEQIAAQLDSLRSQREQLDEQGQKLAEQQERLEAQEGRIAELEEMSLFLNNRLLEMQDQLPDSTLTVALQERLDRLETSVQELPELPAEVVGAGEFPGSMRIPGTDAMIKLGGRVKTSLVLNLDALASDDRFFTAGIPMEGSPEAGKGPRLTLSARSSRFNVDLRTPTGVGHVRAFIEGDFAGEGNTFRLRHAYGQYNRYLFGQTWSTLVDLKAVPEEIDFEGLNAQILLRKAQLRGTYPLGNRSISVGIEDPAPDLSGANGVSLIPDLVAGTEWEVGEGHLQTSFIFRMLKGEVESAPNETYSQPAFGVSVSGRLNVPVLAADDNVRFAVHYGEGYGRYINDLGAEGGQDAVMDTVQGSLRRLPVGAGYLSYAHWWQAEKWRSTICFGYVRVRNLDIQDDEAYHATHRLSANLIYSPAPRMDVGIEFLTGRRENKDRRYGTASQIQLAWYFRF